MGTKIGYVRRDPSEQINWAEVGSNFSGMLNEEARVREEKKAEIDRATREQQRVLDDAVTGDSKNMNEWSLTYAAKAQKQLLMTNALLKNGQLKPQDYTVIRQNMADGTDQAFTLAQEYQDEYKVKMARHKANPGMTVDADGNKITGSQQLEIFLMGTAEGFGNFSKSELVINPQTGKILVGFYDENGELDKDPNKLVGINSLRNRIKGKFDAYDMDAAIAKAKKQTFGKFAVITGDEGSLYEKGLLITTTGSQLRTPDQLAEMVKRGDISQADADAISTIAKTENAWAESQLSNTYNITSLLTNNLGGLAPNGEEYTFTYEASEENENTILLENEGNMPVPVFESAQGKKHREAAKKGLIENMRGALDVDINAQVVGGTQYRPKPQPSATTIASGNKIKEDNAIVGTWGQLYNGTAKQQTAAVQTILGTKIAKTQGLEIIDNTSKPGYVILTYDGTGTIAAGTREIPKVTVDGTPVGYEAFAQSGNEVTGVDDTSAAVIAAGGNADLDYNETPSGKANRNLVAKPPSPLVKLTAYVENSSPPVTSFGNSNGGALTKFINDKYSRLKFSAVEGTYTDVVTITAPDKVTKKDFHYDDKDTYDDVVAEIKAFINANTPTTLATDLMLLNNLGGNASDY